MIDLTNYWWPLVTSAELDLRKPLSRTLLNKPLVVFRNADGEPAILHDRCPHRHAPLSKGRVVSGELECPYHGWRFDSNGCCTRVPGMESGRANHKMLAPVAVREVHGMVWGCLRLTESTPAPVGPTADGKHVDAFFMTAGMNCSMQAGMENLLDGFHTHFVHAGWIRRDKKRQIVKAKVRPLADGVEAHYGDEGLQSGLISTLLEGSRTESMGRFRLPGVAEIEYRGERGLNLLLTAWATPEVDGRLHAHVRVATRRGMIPAWLKRLFLRRLFGVVLLQDKTILEQTQANIERFEHTGGQTAFLDSELDLLGPSIRRLLNGEELDGEKKEMSVRL